MHGGYTFDALSNKNIKKAFIVDGQITNQTRERAKIFNQVELVEGTLGSDETHAKVGKIDAVIMFDILLHQANPNWDLFINKYCSTAKILIIYNQNWIGGDKTVRFIDLGLEKYLELVPHTNKENVSTWFKKHEIYNEEQNCLNKNIHNFWQFGITTPDMLNTIFKQGYDLDYFETYGQWSEKYPLVQNIGLIAVKKTSI